MNATGIEWTDYSASLLKYREKATGKVVWGCVKESPGCASCYSEAMAKRFGRGGPFSRRTMDGLEPFFDEAEAARLLRSRKIAGKRLFLNDMTDTFGPWVPDAVIDRTFALFALRPDVTWQVLTKHPDRAAYYLRWDGMGCGPLADWQDRLGPLMNEAEAVESDTRLPFPWPLPNVWIGTSVEDQKRADERIPHLLRCPAAVRFLSCEPLLGPVALTNSVGKAALRAMGIEYAGKVVGLGGKPFVDWVIVGGESGADARACRVEWLRSIVAECRAARVPVFVKQFGANVTTTLPDREVWPGHDGPTSRVQFRGDGFGNYHVSGLKDRKGGDPSEWPEPLRIREFPALSASTGEPSR
jgi:protein gp37